MLIYQGVSKRFRGNVVLDGVSVEFRPGVVHALLGPNGSGKSTLMKMALGLVRPDSGRVVVGGVDPVRDPVSARRIVGYCPEEVVLYESLTPGELFSFVSSIYGVPNGFLRERIERLVRLFKLGDQVGKLCGELSLGNKRKLSLILALLHEPAVLILDEPFNGLDPESGRILKELLRKLASERGTVVFSTHILEIAEAVADNVVILSRGRVVGAGSPKELKERLSAPDLESVFLRATGLSDEVKEMIRLLWGF